MHSSLQELLKSMHNAVILAAMMDFIIWVAISFFIFTAGRWYERSLIKKQREDDEWEPEEPTL